MNPLQEPVRNDIFLLLGAIHQKYGYDLRQYAMPSLQRRIERIMQKEKFEEVESLQKALFNDEKLFARFLQEFTVNVTEMFRDPSFYRALRNQVLKHLATYPHIRIWHAGCSTGEEVYSMAIMLKEENLLDRTVLYATDIDPQVINEAKKGVFSINVMQNYTKNYITSGGKKDFSSYYTAYKDVIILNPKLKEKIVFAVHNLAQDQSFNEFHLILCRNVLIYFNKELQSRVLTLFRESLVNLGYLALGDKESIHFSGVEKKFKVIDATSKIWQRI